MKGTGEGGIKMVKYRVYFGRGYKHHYTYNFKSRYDAADWRRRNNKYQPHDKVRLSAVRRARRRRY